MFLIGKEGGMYDPKPIGYVVAFACGAVGALVAHAFQALCG